MAGPLQFTETERGGRKLAYEGYQYTYKKCTTDGTQVWECILRRNLKACNATVKLVNDVILQQPTEHTHPPNPVQFEVDRARSSIKRRSRETNDETRTIIGQGAQGLSQEAAAHIGTTDNLARDVRRHRGERNPPVPGQNDHLFNIDDEFKRYHQDPFLRYDNNRQDRLLMFSTPQCINFLTTADDWFLEGTFATAPPQFVQIYTIHGMKDRRNVPCVYGLLPNKRHGTYLELFDQVDILTDNYQPRSILSDFEIGAINAFAVNHPATAAKGCLFHLGQSVYRHVVNNGLRAMYINDQAFKTRITSLNALAFVPPGDVVDSFQELVNECAINGNHEQQILSYFENTYIGPIRAGVRADPIFPIQFWNVTDRMLNQLPRTNNALEGWHSQFGASFNCRHPDIYKVIRAFRREEALSRMKIAAITAGRPHPVPKPRYRRIEENLLRIYNDYPNRQILDYLRGISYNLHTH